VLPDTVKTEWESPQFLPYKEAFPPECRVSQEALIAHVQDAMARDVKASDLKGLQGYLCGPGWRSGVLKAPLFEDVAPHFTQWKKGRVSIMIYSSGAVAAQKLLFKHTNNQPADLVPAITDFFDITNAGPKTQPSSYERIARKYKRHPVENWLFLSDNVKEVEAAIAAGMQSFVVHRPGNPALTPSVHNKYRVIRSFDELDGAVV
jgi:enolase-phosphatase E1